ncbi:MAG: hypothetical protein LUE29_04310 [Lachnospiraceae bacterium]|nr:hypothetical protein [Lachnospiraceae bacterium]
MTDQIKEYLKDCLWVATGLFVVRCLISWPELVSNLSAYTLFGFAGEAIGVTSIIMTIYERFLWKYNPLSKVPKLKCNYEGVVCSTYDEIERKASIEIKQTLLTVHVTMVTAESKSKSITATIEEVLGEKQLIYSYLNTPESGYRKRSEIHYGTAMLCIDNPNEISGQYYTDRKTTGNMTFSESER